MKLEFSRQVSKEKKKLRYQISSKPVQWEPSYSIRTDGQAYRHDKAESHFSQFYKRASKGSTHIFRQKKKIYNNQRV
jgi:hypothetical protein